jgi:hypothetical protein
VSTGNTHVVIAVSMLKHSRFPVFLVVDDRKGDFLVGIERSVGNTKNREATCKFLGNLHDLFILTDDLILS